MLDTYDPILPFKCIAASVTPHVWHNFSNETGLSAYMIVCTENAFRLSTPNISTGEKQTRACSEEFKRP